MQPRSRQVPPQPSGIALDHRDLEAHLGGADGGHVAAGSAADDGHVEDLAVGQGSSSSGGDVVRAASTPRYQRRAGSDKDTARPVGRSRSARIMPAMSEPVLIVVAIVLLLLGNGFFSGSEIAIISARRSRIDALVAEGSRAARRVKDLQDNMDRFLATVQIGVTVMGTLAGVLGGYLASRHLEPLLEDSWLAAWLPAGLEAAFVVGLGIVYVELMLGELVPKALALRYTRDGGAPGVLVRFTSWPGLALADRLPDRLHPRRCCALFGIRDFGARTFVSEEEIKHLVTRGPGAGGPRTRPRWTSSTASSSSRTPRCARSWCPRPKIFALDVDTPPDRGGRADRGERLLAHSRLRGLDRQHRGRSSTSRTPCACWRRRQPVVLRKILHPGPLRARDRRRSGALLKELQKRRSHLALVIDEHGSLTGLVTLEDLLEEIVGEIHDEYDWEERPVERLRDGSLVVEGTVSAAELRDSYEVPMPESEEFETVAGFMLERLGSVPKGGEVVHGGRLPADRGRRGAQPHQQGQDREGCRRGRQGQKLGLRQAARAGGVGVRGPGAGSARCAAAPRGGARPGGDGGARAPRRAAARLSPPPAGTTAGPPR